MHVQANRDDWARRGRFEGHVYAAAAARLLAVGRDASVCLDVLDAIQADEKLAGRLAIHAALRDLRVGRSVIDLSEENAARAVATVNLLEEHWPAMRRQLREALLVALKSLADDLVTSLVVEFSADIGSESKADDSLPTKAQWTSADRLCRIALKKCHSASAAWSKLVVDSTLPEFVKQGLIEWDSTSRRRVDELVLVRNCLVHRGARLDPQTARLLQLEPDARLEVTEAMYGSYRSACVRFIFALDPPFPAGIL